MTEYTVMHDGDFEWVEHGPETLYAEDCANKLNQLQATNKQLLSALEKIVAAHNSEENAGGGFLSWDELTQAEQAITNAKGE